ncbi:MAG: HupE/UreJ family protein [Deltaproteobacteria bacterium]|jgi:hydrogenase/urease accessory protein HupE|nr:HupE/UreJ family protein [Deltaproteobacteria bacterium]
MMKRLLFNIVLCVLTLCSALSFQAQAHESQPGMLELNQLTDTRFEVVWRAPIYYGKPHPAQLELPDKWQIIGNPTFRQLSDSALHRLIVEVPNGSIDRSVVRFPGLESTITDVFIVMTRLDNSQMTQVVRPTEPFAELRGERSWYVSSKEYLVLGLNHILTGVDHLLFVLGLLLIVSCRWMLLKTITAFTIAHSITLAIATLGYASAPGPPLNAAIALSILFLGPEIVRVWRGQTSFTIRHPWVVAFAFGLLHGFGFASGLTTNGLPSAEIPVALLLFNVGVEIGQLFFVAIIILLERSFRMLEIHWPRWAEAMPAYTIGGLGAFWTIQRVAMMFGGFAK